ncbi:carboxyltransferase domain-containing protein [Rothia sp. ZJ932]|uniref:5-oxoprolinase subunit B/C family protein n=1 Tax=Rothia sp. ZJ932 TaxID=2810516 RepID=UPI0019682663|nr:carboxyltransferase domain-containing protein [Rothia sp. ZJ932]QRZ61497.1 carboxyltransferase domain-containing protein [Rothia sp. ZJ932]
MTRIKRFSLNYALVDCNSLQHALSVHAHLTEHPTPGQIELIPAAQTVLVHFATPQQTESFITSFTVPEHSETTGTQTTTRIIETVYTGEDLNDVANATGLSVEEVITKHSSASWQVAFAGFAPGFFYLHAPDNTMDVPRRATPRTSVPAGSVGLAGQLSGIYPRSSPGGWQLIGHTNAPLWDLTQNPPALLEPGNTVQFKPVRELVEIPASASVTPPQPPEKGVARLDAPGLQTVYQDGGRDGLSHWGVSPSGFADIAAAHEANRLVGNAVTVTLLENLGGGLKLTATDDIVLAVTGAQVSATVTSPDEADDKTPRTVRLYKAFALKPSETLQLGPTTGGLRTYLALRGGFEAPVEAGSTSRDTLSGLGAPPLTTGQTLYTANLPASAVAVGARPLDVPSESITLRVIAGPRDDWFTTESLEKFTATSWQVSDSSDRIGVRLTPENPRDSTTPVLQRSREGELPSEGMVTGAIQVPPNGEPVIFLSDRPVTGGYPVIASVHPADLRLLAQAPPTTRVTFTFIDPAS